MLKNKPFHVAQRAVCIKEPLKYIHRIGFLDRMETKGRENIKSITDTDFLEWLYENDFKYEDLYDVSCDTHENANKSILKYDAPEADFTLCDQECLRGARADVLDLWRVMDNSARILEFGEVTYVPATNPGAIYKMAGFKTKRDAVVYCMPEIKEFWKTAHLQEYDVLWKQAAKIELLKKTKLAASDLRGFTCPPVDFFASKARMCQHFNELSHQWAYNLTTMQRCGVALQHGGFNWLMSQMEGMTVGEGDCNKWDGPLSKHLFDVCIQVRYNCWDKKGMAVGEWWQRMRYYYNQTVNSYILLPSGQVIRKFIGNPSGDVNTTMDNCIMHMFVICYVWRRFFGASHLREPKSTFPIFNLYADDNVFGTNKIHKEFHDFELRSKYYAELGISLSREKDFSGTTGPEGHTFLGPKAIRTGYGWAPLYNRDKIVCSMLHLSRAFKPGVLLARTLSLMVNATFDEPLFNLLRQYALRLIQRGIEVDKSEFTPDERQFFSTSTPPTWEQCRNFWFGYE